ncbi:MAG: hypothetical protein EP330_01940 [Deltaproteobacteria bacterium]|nr:MAG: hypothetical protein EP330_01940 [Deltaproteobacteria bacterium]
MLIPLLAVTLASAAEPAKLKDGAVELISDKRESISLQDAVTPVLAELGTCSEHTGGLDYGDLTLTFMVDKKGNTANYSVRSDYLLPKELTKCLTAPLEEVNLGRGDVAVAKFVIKLP